MIFEDLIDKDMQILIEDTTLGGNFPWYFCPFTIDLSNLTNEKKEFVYEQGINPSQFVHTLVDEHEINSKHFILIEPILQNLAKRLQKNISVKKAKFNFLPQNHIDKHHFPHVDTNPDDQSVMSMIYYVNNSDGDTYFFDDTYPRTKEYTDVIKKITPKKGKAIVFEGKQFHASSSPIISEKRIVLNVVFKTI